MPTEKQLAYWESLKGKPTWNKGLKFSDESRNRMSEAKKGKPTWNKGKKMNKEWGERISKMWDGKPEDKRPRWKGDGVGYVAIHEWVKKHRGAPKYCEHCKKTDKKKYEWANIDHLYERILEKYIRLCTSCHRRYDIENNNYKV